MTVCPSVRHVWRGAAGREHRKEGGMGRGGISTRLKGGGGGGGEGDFTDGYDRIPGWTYFSRVTPGHPSSK